MYIHIPKKIDNKIKSKKIYIFTSDIDLEKSCFLCRIKIDYQQFCFLSVP